MLAEIARNEKMARKAKLEVLKREHAENVAELKAVEVTLEVYNEEKKALKIAIAKKIGYGQTQV